MAKANKKAAAKSAKGAAPKKGAMSAKAAAPKKGAKAAKGAAPKKGAKSAKAAAPKKAMKNSKAAVKSPAALRSSSKAARPKASSAMDQRTMLTNLFVEHLKDIYWAEKALTKALPRMRKAATTPELQQAFDEHLQVTNGQIGRLDQVFELMGKKAQGKKCDAMEGLVKEAESVISETQKGSKTRDVGLIIAAQKVEHYEIASYGGLAQLAKTMGLEEVKNLLGQTLEEEKQTDALLTDIAENSINIEAEQEGGTGGGGGAQGGATSGENEGGGLANVTSETNAGEGSNEGEED